MGSHPLIEDQLTKKGGLPPNIELPPRKHSSAPVSALSFAKLLAFEPIMPRCRMRRDRTWIFTSPGSGSATNRLITAKDHASVQINVGHLDEAGCYTGQFTTFALCGFVRAQCRVDVFGEVENSFSYEKILKAGDSKEYFSRGRMGDADGAVDRLWQKKKVEARQQ
ncbi:unnamed protein product [Camellia sinensis]